MSHENEIVNNGVEQSRPARVAPGALEWASAA
jgi:hypothetical protein